MLLSLSLSLYNTKGVCLVMGTILAVWGRGERVKCESINFKMVAKCGHDRVCTHRKLMGKNWTHAVERAGEREMYVVCHKCSYFSWWWPLWVWEGEAIEENWILIAFEIIRWLWCNASNWLLIWRFLSLHNRTHTHALWLRIGNESREWEWQQIKKEFSLFFSTEFNL